MDNNYYITDLVHAFPYVEKGGSNPTIATKAPISHLCYSCIKFNHNPNDVFTKQTDKIVKNAEKRVQQSTFWYNLNH